MKNYFFFNQVLSLSSSEWAAGGLFGPKPWLSALCRSCLWLPEKDTPTPAKENDKKYNRANKLVQAKMYVLAINPLEGW